MRPLQLPHFQRPPPLRTNRPALPRKRNTHDIPLRTLDQLILVAMPQDHQAALGPPLGPKAPRHRRNARIPLAVGAKRARHKRVVHARHGLRTRGHGVVLQQEGQIVDACEQQQGFGAAAAGEGVHALRGCSSRRRRGRRSGRRRRTKSVVVVVVVVVVGVLIKPDARHELQEQSSPARMADAYPAPNTLFAPQMAQRAHDVAQVLRVLDIAVRVVGVARLRGVGRVRREAVVEAGDAADAGERGWVRGDEVVQRGRDVAGGFEWVAPGAAVDVDYPGERTGRGGCCFVRARKPDVEGAEAAGGVGVGY